MKLNFTISFRRLAAVRKFFTRQRAETWVVVLAVLLSAAATAYFFKHDYIVAYGDAESHLNIAKRVVSSLTPGFAQLGGIWLPLPHILLAPFVYFNFLWRTGLAGSIVSGLCYVVAALYLYKLMFLLSKKSGVAFFSVLVFMLNPNVLYLQATPMTELTLLVFFVLSSYFFIKYLGDQAEIKFLLLAAMFGFFAALSRYDGWFLIGIEALALLLVNFPYSIDFKQLLVVRKLSHWRSAIIFRRTNSAELLKQQWKKLEGRIILFSTLAFFSLLLWLGWDGLILGDPLYFTHSQFSAKSQQLGWLAKGQLPAYHHLGTSFVYYFVTAMDNIGAIVFVLAIAGLLFYVFKSKDRHRFIIPFVLLVPFGFYVVTLFLGQSIIFIPGVTPSTFEWTLFNARYGVMMVPVAAVFLGYLFYRSRIAIRLFLVAMFIFQLALFGIGYTKVITLQDGIAGLSTAKRPDAERWMAQNYDKGLVLLDDYARTISVIRSGVPMQDVIYIGNKPYWGDSLVAPEKYATWIIMQKDDAVWKNIYDDAITQGRLYKYFEKVYTSPEILIFKRNPNVPSI